ncbi:MAG: hypothetical protein EP345_06100 [Sphingomonadales bacterium]|nr:MAG: hypothetical protein EP345_06100 [Sphingomonadales bacterium]
MGTILIALAAFMLGVLITSLLALGAIAILYREAAAMVDSYMNAVPGARIPRGSRDWRPLIIAGGGAGV